MIVTVTQYILMCDEPACGKKSGCSHSVEHLFQDALSRGWVKRRGTDSAFDVLCPSCVRKQPPQVSVQEPVHGDHR